MGISPMVAESKKEAPNYSGAYIWIYGKI